MKRLPCRISAIALLLAATVAGAWAAPQALKKAQARPGNASAVTLTMKTTTAENVNRTGASMRIDPRVAARVRTKANRGDNFKANPFARPVTRRHFAGTSSSVMRTPLKAGAYADKYVAALVYGGGIFDEGVYEGTITAGGTLTQISSLDLAYYESGIYDIGDQWVGLHLESDGQSVYLDYSGMYAIDEGMTTATLIEGSDIYQMYDAFFDPVDNCLYGFIYWYGKSDGTQVSQPGWAKISVTTGKVEAFKNVTDDESYPRFGYVAGAPDGRTWGADFDGNLYEIDRATGNVTFKFEVEELYADYLCTAAWDAASQTIIAAPATDNPTELISVDPTTGTATTICTYQNDVELVGMNIDNPLVAEGVPGRVTDLAANFTGNSLEGTVTFTVPTETFDGATLSGSLTYHLFVNEEEKESKSCTAGEAVTYNFTAPANGNYTFKVYVSNDKGDGPAAQLVKFIGDDAPAAASDAKAVWADGKFTITWAPIPTTGVNGGTIDPAQAVYKVTITPGDETKTTNAGETTLVWDYPEPEDYTRVSFSIVATVNGSDSAPVTTPLVAVGSVTPPYANTFKTEDEFNQMSQIVNSPNPWYYNASYECAAVSYDSSEPMDAYLITPPIKMEAGKNYDIDFNAANGSNTYPEAVELVVASTMEALETTTSLTGRVDLTKTWSEGGTDISATFSPTTSGTYYVAIHGVSDANELRLEVRNLTVSGAISGDAPEPVSNLTATADPTGALKATLTFDAPTKSLSGNALTGKINAKITRDGLEVANMEISGSVTWEDNSVTTGEHVYEVVASNDAGASRAAQASCYVGLAAPANIDATTLSIVETATLGTVEFSWAPVTVDINGKPLQSVTYTLYDAQTGETLSENATSPYTYVVCIEGQAFAQLAVQAVTAEGKSAIAYSEMIAVGSPYIAPYAMSFADGEINGILGVEGLNDAGAMLIEYNPFSDGLGIGIADDSTFTGITSSDSDNGMLFALWDSFYAMFFGMPKAQVFTGSITIPADMENPAAAVDYYGLAPEIEDRYALKVREAGTTEWTSLGEALAAGDAEWLTLKGSLDAFKGKTVELAVEFEMVSTINMLFDNIRIFSQVDYDLSNVVITLPEEAPAGEDLDATVTFTNNGGKDVKADEYTVELYKDGALLESKPGVDVAAGKKASVAFDGIATSPVAESATFKAVVVFANDQTPDNNESGELKVTLTFGTMPGVNDLAAVRNDDNSVTLTWTKPVAESYKTEVESFENCEANTTDIPGWTMYDADALPNGGINGVDIPGIETGVDPMAFVVVEPESLGLSTALPYSGTKCIINMYSVGGANEDWLISPELCGQEQVISFFARSYSATYPETFQVMYSTTDNNPESFELVDGSLRADIPAEWAQYSCRLPEGTKYFAIVCVSDDAFMLMIDDISYMGNEPYTLQLVSFDIYRDGVRVNDAAVTDATFTDTTAGPAACTYNVITVWQEGMSRPSNTATVAESGIDTISVAEEGTEYFNLLGQPVKTLRSGEVYIGVNSRGAKKVIVK